VTRNKRNLGRDQRNKKKKKEIWAKKELGEKEIIIF